MKKDASAICFRAIWVRYLALVAKLQFCRCIALNSRFFFKRNRAKFSAISAIAELSTNSLRKSPILLPIALNSGYVVARIFSAIALNSGFQPSDPSSVPILFANLQFCYQSR